MSFHDFLICCLGALWESLCVSFDPRKRINPIKCPRCRLDMEKTQDESLGQSWYCPKCDIHASEDFSDPEIPPNRIHESEKGE